MQVNREIIEVLRAVKKHGCLDLAALNTVSETERNLIIRIYKEGVLDEALKFAEDLDGEESWNVLKTKFSETPKHNVSFWKKAYKYAAVFVSLLAIIAIVKNTTVKEIEFHEPSEAIELVMENGEIQIISAQSNKQIKLKNGQVIGEQSGTDLNYVKDSKLEKLVYNELRIPNGKKFNITLSDGTLVYLNAGSSLKYPVHFIQGSNREVFLEGEAYFDVSKDKAHPFIVNAGDMNIKVLGTEFNVSSYKEDETINTVLVEGAVSLYNDANPGKTALLSPGYKAEWNKVDNEIALDKVDTNRYISWMNGEMVFRNESFITMMKIIERNYGVQIAIKDTALNDLRFTGTFNVNIEDVGDILESLSQMYPFAYTIREKNIIIN